MSETAPPIEPPKQLSRKVVRVLRIIALFLILFTLTVAGISVARLISNTIIGSQRKRAKAQLSAFSIALVNYESDFRALPPPDANFSDIPLEKYLCHRLSIGNSDASFGPYIALPDSGTKNPWGRGRFYVVRLDATGKPEALIIDPGPDGLLGGAIDASGHFVPDHTDANNDGEPDDQDNIYSLPNP